MSKPFLADSLVESVKRRAQMPQTQKTFSKDDFLEILNEEMDIGVLASILKLHEEFYLVTEEVLVIAHEVRYPLPYRAIGNKLRDVQYKDGTANFYNLSRVTVEDLVDFPTSVTSNRFNTFFMRGDEIELLNENTDATGSLLFAYFLRPNELVENARGAKVTAIANDVGTITISSSANLISGTVDTITVQGVAFTATNGAIVAGETTFDASGTDTATASSLASQVNAHTIGSTVTAIASTTTVQITGDTSTVPVLLSYTDNDANVGASVSTITTTITLDAMPSNISTTFEADSTVDIDFVRAKSPNIILGWDRPITAISSTAPFSITFETDRSVIQGNPREQSFTTETKKNTSVLRRLQVGDYITEAGETIVPNIPSELQHFLAQRAAVYCLESIGDVEGYKLAKNKLDEMELNIQSIIDNRVEGAPIKLVNKYSTLRAALSRSYYRGGY